jgi:subtilisin family serine protease
MPKKKPARTARPPAPRKPRVAAGAPQVQSAAIEPPSFPTVSEFLAADVDLPVMQGTARTIVYIHGIANKPPADVLKCQWDHALYEFDLGERSRMAYWVNRETYPIPYPGTCQAGDLTAIPMDGATHGVRAAALTEPLASVVGQIDGRLDPQARASLERLAHEMEVSQLAQEAIPATLKATRGYGTKIVPLPERARRWLTRHITRLLLQDVYEFFFDAERRKAMRASLLDRLSTGGGPFVVIGHSQGSMIAYDVLCGLDPTAFEIPLFITIGSPLGLTEVQDQLKRLTGQRGGLAVPRCVKCWVNVSDPLDPVSLDHRLRNDIRSRGSVHVEDFIARNPDSPRDPHSATGYLQMSVVRQAVQRAVSAQLFQRISPFTVARDLVKSMEGGERHDRHPVLIELFEARPGRDRDAGMSLAVQRERVVEWIRSEIQAPDPALTDEVIKLDVLSKYVAVELTQAEVERLAARLRQGTIHHVYRNARKRALLDESLAAVQALPAHRGYDAQGQNITWAVLDTGIDPDHAHFKQHANVQRVFDCTQLGSPVLRTPANPKVGFDGNGHGTHVAGIIAGEYQPPGAAAICGVAPRAQLWIYKVLKDNGQGSDAFIIKALDHIAETNRAAGSLVIHGVNLSLGGPFDVTSFGCGHTPLCKELHELWRQGVLVVLAAGNEGYLEIEGTEGEVPLNLDLSIGDPANLEEAIAVGSVHRSKPHHYGVSFFSSRGPTADGRPKPDVVAPGERILSARAGGKGTKLDDLYVRLSGTSMAAPHVSGVLAAFLSARTEFIGDPDGVKERLVANCTDLGRDRMHQGAGLPNLVKMLLNT